MIRQSSNQHLSMMLVLVLLAVMFVACDKSESAGRSSSTRTPIDTSNIVRATKGPVATFTPPECVGLFVGMQDRASGSLSRFRTSIRRDGFLFKPRVYVFSLEEPILVTTAVLVIGSGQLEVQDTHPLSDFLIRIVNDEGQDVPFTEEGKKVFDYRSGTGSSRWNWVDHDTPLIEAFHIDEWFDLSSPGTYTMTLTRKIWDSDNKLLSIPGNAVTFMIWE